MLPKKSDSNEMEIFLSTHHKNEIKEKMTLYSEDIYENSINAFVSKLTNYKSGIAPSSNDRDLERSQNARAKLGTVLGVFLPCFQNIVGVILFIRLPWIVGVAGVLESMLIILICGLCTFCTSVSLSAIATNGIIPGGGVYFLLSRSLGPEFGGAVGILFYLATTFASSLYIIGGVEIVLLYMAPSIRFGVDEYNEFFSDTWETNNFRAYGTVVLVVLSLCVLLGLKFVSIVAAISLICVIVSIIAIFIGIFIPGNSAATKVCILGTHLLPSSIYTIQGVPHCIKDELLPNGKLAPLYSNFCLESVCDPIFEDNQVRFVSAIPGITSNSIFDTIFSSYHRKGDEIGHNQPRDSKKFIHNDLTTSFIIFVAIYFPSVTGIMAGSNRSGELRDAQKSIPVGTLAATIATTFLYLISVPLYAAVTNRNLLQDKYGRSIGEQLVVSHIAWPNHWVILIGSLLSTLGAGLQTLTGAPRLLQAIASDGIIPFLSPFKKTIRGDNPALALVLTVVIAEIGIIIANVDHQAPIISICFLLCYFFVNFVGVLQALMKISNWRPRFKYYHWTISLLGIILCLAIMFMTSWYYTIAGCVVAGFIYFYIQYKGAEREWGDGIKGLKMSAALYYVRQFQQDPIHVKNWRPLILLFSKPQKENEPETKLIEFASRLKAGKGIIMVSSTIIGKFNTHQEERRTVYEKIKLFVNQINAKALIDVVISGSVCQGLQNSIQLTGLGGLRPNMIIIGWPTNYDTADKSLPLDDFMEIVTNGHVSDKCVAILRNGHLLPEKKTHCDGSIDIWWIAHDGSIIILMGFLLKSRKTWKKCKIRIFAVAQMTDNSVEMKTKLEKLLYDIRIEGEIIIVDMPDSEISAYTVEQTINMENRLNWMRNIGLSSKQANKEPQQIADLLRRNSIKKRNTHPDVIIETPDVHVTHVHTAVELNKLITENSSNAQILIINLPPFPKNASENYQYLCFLDFLTNINVPVFMIRGTGREVVTIFT